MTYAIPSEMLHKYSSVVIVQIYVDKQTVGLFITVG